MPAEAEYAPTGHSVHAVTWSPAGLNVPARHASCVDMLVDEQYCPVLQSKHDVEPGADCHVPMAHAVQLKRPAVDVNVPGEHATQSLESS